MEFDSLAFSATRSAPAQDDRVYCPACMEDCVPEKASAASACDQPTCPTCGEPTTICPTPRPGEPCGIPGAATARSSMNSTSVTAVPASFRTRPPAPASSAAAGEAAGGGGGGEQARGPGGMAATSPPLPAPTNATTPRQQQQDDAPPLGGRAAVSERVAQEVLAFMAAIERGDLSTAVGLPAPPGAALLEDLPGGRGLAAGGGGSRGRSAPALAQVVKDLPRVKVEKNSWVLHQTVLRVRGPVAVKVEAIFAPFSPPPAKSVRGPIVLAVPPTADVRFGNEAEVKGSVVVIDRGGCTFASKALRADAAGAAAAVIVQTHPVWPYVMKDSKGEVEAAGGLGIPVCMVSKENGEAIKKALRAAPDGETVRAELSVSSSEKDCIVCQELYAVGATLVRLPCGHLYHEACLLSWLKISNTCPYCRRQLPSSSEDMERDRRRTEAAEGGNEAWRDFFD